MMGATQAMVSTLLMTVGHPNSPTTAGNGGLRRGKPFFPSSDSNKRCFFAANISTGTGVDNHINIKARAENPFA